MTFETFFRLSERNERRQRILAIKFTNLGSTQDSDAIAILFHSVCQVCDGKKISCIQTRKDAKARDADVFVLHECATQKLSRRRRLERGI